MSEHNPDDTDIKRPDDKRGGTDVLERPAMSTKTKKPSMYNVILLNDDFTPMDFVVFVLMKVFHHNEQDAALIMLQVHRTGKGIAGMYTLEVAEMKVLETLSMAKKAEHPLQALVERV